MDGDWQFLSPQPHEWIKGKVVGSGSFGTVHLAMNKVTGAFFVVKSAESDTGFKFLENEASILKDLESPYIVRYLGRDTLLKHEDDRKGFSIFLEYMSGGSLADVLDKFGGTLDEQVIRLYTREIIHGLQYLHRNGIVHCDLKCKNVLVDTMGRIKLGDFGFAVRVMDMKTNMPLQNSWNNIGGSPLWMAPEVLRKDDLDFASDIWSLGCTVIEMATGRPPWGNDMSNPMAAMFKIGCTSATPKLPVHLSKEGHDFLAKCLERNPKRRSTAAELLNHPFIARNMEDVEEWTCSPASVLDVGIIDEDESESFDASEFWNKNPFSANSLCERNGLGNMPTWWQEDIDSGHSDNWIIVRSS